MVIHFLILRERLSQVFHSVNLFFCITNPAVLENTTFLPNIFLTLTPEQVGHTHVASFFAFLFLTFIF